MAVQTILCNQALCIPKCNNNTLDAKCITLTDNCFSNCCTSMSLEDFVKILCVKVVAYRYELDCMKQLIYCKTTLDSIQVS